MKPPDFTVPDLGPYPLFFGPHEKVEGYYVLDAKERHVGMTVNRAHIFEVECWYQFLTFHQRALLRGFEFECPPKELTAFGLRMQLLSLGISSSKSALDLLLGGRYSIAFAAIRHMIESHVFCRYVEAFPAQASAFYLARLGEPPPPKKPAMRTVIDRLVEVSTDQRDKRLFNDSYDVWKELIDGSHPSAVEITLTLGERDGLGVFEPTYRREFCELGFNRGLSATGKIVHEVGRIQSKDEELEAEMIRLAIRPAQFYGASLDP